MKKTFRKYLGWGVTVLSVGALTILVFFCFFKFSTLAAGVGKLVDILMPIIMGLGIAYVLSPVYNWLRRRMRRLLYRTFHWRGRKAMICAGVLAMILTFCGAFALVGGLLALIVPQIISSVTSFVNSLPSNLTNLSYTLQSLLASNPDLEQNAMSLYAQAVSYIEDWIQQSLAPSMQEAFKYVSVGVLSTVTFLKNFFIGIIVAVYLLAGKDRFLEQLRRVVYAVFGVHVGNVVMRYSRFANQTFTGFISGKLLDSFIIFLICCVCLPILNMPYAMLISVIVGVTNIIPFFGPFIGAIPSFVIILIEDPIRSLIFLAYILILQQLDGNVIGPKILGNSTGISSFGVLFSMLLFGGMFGFIGMLLGVPVYAVLSRIISDIIQQLLERRKLPTDGGAYARLDYIDEKSRTPVQTPIPSPEPKAEQKTAEPEDGDEKEPAAQTAAQTTQGGDGEDGKDGDGGA